MSRCASTRARAPRKYSSTASSRTCPSSAIAVSFSVAGWAGTRRAGRRPPGTGVPFEVRTRWPSTSQPGRRGARSGRREVRPRNSASGATGTPAAASSASAVTSRTRPCSPGTSSGTTVCGRSRRIRPTSPVRTRPGPASTKVRTPAAYMASTCSTNRTGSATWRAARLRTPSAVAGYRPAVVFDQTGMPGADTAVPFSSPASAADAPATTSLWNAQATGSGSADRPASRRALTAAATAGEGPEITHCRGALWFATTHPARAATSRTSSGAADTAAIAPGSAPVAARIASARRSLSRSRPAMS